MSAPVVCPNCSDTGFVCEDHPDRPWGGIATGDHVCTCHAAGMPCPTCCDLIPTDGSRHITDAFQPRHLRQNTP